MDLNYSFLMSLISTISLNQKTIMQGKMNILKLEDRMCIY
jgi:hypothetical protein